jgi:ribosomal protein S18 acetylase RimI-like enzyme
MISFEQAGWAEPLRAGFEAAGWRATRLVWMHHEGPRPSRDGDDVRAVAYDAVASLRAAWHEEDFPGQDAAEFHSHAREVALARGSRVLAMVEGGEPIAFAALDARDDEIEIGAVYVLPAYRGRGRGTVLTRAAIAAAGEVEHLWICADADDRPKNLYARLGFRPVLTTTDFLKLPARPGAGGPQPTVGADPSPTA